MKVFVNLSREIIKESPEYTAKSLVTGIMRLNCINITIAKATGLMNW